VKNVNNAVASNSLPIVIAGMHRSGTSLMASCLQALGVDVGSNLMPANAHNQKGYFEDVEFVDLHRAIFRAACPAEDAGWPEVGYTESEQLDMARVAPFTEAAKQLIEARRDLPIWGWKDPRTTLLLPFWHELLPNARYVLVYRHPWDVADSLYRRGDSIIATRPDYAYRIWTYYNRRMLAFYNAHREQCLLVSTNALSNQMEKVVRLLEEKLGLPLSTKAPAETLRAIFDGELMRDLPLDHGAVALAHAHCPDAIATLRALEAAADVPGHSETVAPTLAAFAALHRASVQGDLGPSALMHENARLVDEAQSQAEELRRIQVRETELVQLVAARDAALWEMRNSTSWRLTTPIRAIKTALRPDRR
jgi:hypothetical protein